MKKINFKNGAAGKTPLNATNLNSLQDNVEDEIITSKTTDIAEALTITDCAGVNGSLDIKEGKTIQEGTPTPTTPIDIRNVGDNIQLFDGELELGTLKNEDGTTNTNNSCIRSVNYTKVNSNNIYTISNDKNYAQYIYEYDKDKTFIKYTANTNSKFTFTTTETTKYIKFRTTAGDVQNDLTTLFKLEKGTKATSYSKYGCGSVGVKVESENVFDKNNANTLNAVIQSSTMKIATTNGAKLAYIEVKPNTTYTVSKIVSSRFAIGSCNGIPVAGTTTCNSYVAGNTNSKLTITTTENDNYLCIYYYYNQTDTLTEQEILNSIKVIEKSKTVVFPLAEGQLLHKGDYLAEDGIHQKRTTIILDGTEGWAIENNVSLNNYRQFRVSYFVNARSDSFGNSDVQKCTHFKCINVNNNEEYGFTVNGSKQLAINYDIVTVNELKSYLAEQYANGTPVTVEYELAEETITPYTEEQKEAYYQLQHLLMYEGYTSIECIEDIKPDIQATYLYNNELNNYYGSRIDELETEIKDKADCKLNGDFAVLSGSITTTAKEAEENIYNSVSIAYPSGFSKDNSVVVSIGINQYTNKGLGFESLDVSDIRTWDKNGLYRNVLFEDTDIKFTVVTPYTTAHTIDYKIVLMKI